MGDMNTKENLRNFDIGNRHHMVMVCTGLLVAEVEVLENFVLDSK
jgi:hypothetical protein